MNLKSNYSWACLITPTNHREAGWREREILRQTPPVLILCRRQSLQTGHRHLYPTLLFLARVNLRVTHIVVGSWESWHYVAGCTLSCWSDKDNIKLLIGSWKIKMTLMGEERQQRKFEPDSVPKIWHAAETHRTRECYFLNELAEMSRTESVKSKKGRYSTSLQPVIAFSVHHQGTVRLQFYPKYVRNHSKQ